MKSYLKKYYRTIIFIVLFVFLSANLFYGFNIYSNTAKIQSEEDGYSQIYKLMFVINRIRKDYVDPEKVSYKNLVRGALKGILRELDPFCSYMEPEAYKNIVEETEGKEYGGVGMVVSYKDGALIVVAPMDNSPAFKAGIKPGDIIREINGKSTSTMNLDECVKMLKGPPGTNVELEILREGQEEGTRITITRENIEVSPVISGKTISPEGIAYIRITQFNVPTASKLDEELATLKQNGMKALVIDLRGNPGGLLNSAIEVCSRFIETGKLVVSTEGRNPNQKQEFKALNCKKYLDSGDEPLPIAILIDNSSASASEIFAGCLKDYKRAVLIGETTFGKGSVQTIMPLPEDDGAIRLTTAKYFTPNKLQIHEHGITPDITVPLDRKAREKIYNQRIAYPGIVKPDMHNAIPDIQLERAYEVLKGIQLYQSAKN